ncbi:MAG TPA: di-heme oxidoredictase family protein [Pyrinomonadaceae bacterium]|jgi:CxxC motif-containing protein (DUF1111 family)|nr:di-heme oxidoredictase family protein [Pyrinomonadaceae bacterium]
MRVLRISALVLMLAALLMLPAANQTVHSVATEQADQANVAATTDATYTSGSVDLEGVAEDDTTTYTFSTTAEPSAAATPAGTNTLSATQVATIDANCDQPPAAEAPAFGFDDQTNGLIPQGDPKTPGTFVADKITFEDVDQIDDGLGPVYNAQSCRECHQNPVTGAISQITELRAGHTVDNTFFDAPGGSLINNRGIPTPQIPADAHKSAKVQERVPPLFTAAIISGPALTAEEPTRTFRTSLNTLGDGFVEAIADGTLVAIANRQKGQTNQEVHGLVINVPVLEAGGRKRVGRFGWKNQHASLLSFSGDAYLNEIGITNFLVRQENTSLGRFVGYGTPFDKVPDDTPCVDDPSILCGEDKEQDIKVFAEFMRATQAPPRDTDIIKQFPDVAAGAALFESMNGQYSCSVCHVPSIMTANNCQPINGGEFTVPPALARKVIHPFGDFLLHDIGTGDLIVQNGGPITRTRVRTAPLWGVRTRTNLMHDGESLTFNDAILRHSGEALQVRLRYQALTATQKRQLITFLESL